MHNKYNYNERKQKENDDNDNDDFDDDNDNDNDNDDNDYENKNNNEGNKKDSINSKVLSKKSNENSSHSQESHDYIQLYGIITSITENNKTINTTDSTTIRNALLLLYPLFTDSYNIMKALKERFFEVSNSDIVTYAWPTHVKVINIIQQWMREYWIEDFENNSYLINEMQLFLNNIQTFYRNAGFYSFHGFSLCMCCLCVCVVCYVSVLCCVAHVCVCVCLCVSVCVCVCVCVLLVCVCVCGFWFFFAFFPLFLHVCIIFCDNTFIF